MYAGESLAKKIARAVTYNFIASRLGSRLGQATVFGLAGPEANDLGPISAFKITADPSNVLLADFDSCGLNVAAARGARTFQGSIEDAPIPWPSVDVAMLDWCGAPDSPAALRTYQKLRPYMRRGSIIAVTYLRGREGAKSELKKIVRSLDHLSKPFPVETLRACTPGVLLGEALGLMPATVPADLPNGLRDNDLILHDVGQVKYQGHASPMAISILQIVRKMDFCKVWRKNINCCLWDERKRSESNVDCLLRHADEYEARGIDPAAAFSVSRGTLAAWRAHRTMGTYGSAAV